MKKYFSLLLFLWCIFGLQHASLIPEKALAAVAIDQSTSSNGTASWSHTVNNNPNQVLIVGGSGNITAVSYKSTPLTRLLSYTGPKTGATVSIWYLKNPPTGTN